MQPLTSKQLKFVFEYVKDMNPRRAAKAAGYIGDHGPNILRKKHVMAEINAQMKRIGMYVEPTKERVLAELMRLAFYDPKDFFYDNGNPKPISEIPEDARRCIAGIELAMEGRGEDATLVQKIKLCDKQKALQDIGRYLAMFTDKMKLDVNTELDNLNDEQLRNTVKQLAEATGFTLGDAEAPKTKH